MLIVFYHLRICDLLRWHFLFSFFLYCIVLNFPLQHIQALRFPFAQFESAQSKKCGIFKHFKRNTLTELRVVLKHYTVNWNRFRFKYLYPKVKCCGWWWWRCAYIRFWFCFCFFMIMLYLFTSNGDTLESLSSWNRVFSVGNFTKSSGKWSYWRVFQKYVNQITKRLRLPYFSPCINLASRILCLCGKYQPFQVYANGL